MLDVISQAKNAIESYNIMLKAISSNITNTSVTGFKKFNVSFESVFTKTKNAGTSGRSSDEGGTNPIQEGGTVAVANTSIDFKQGDMAGGGNLDLGISGGGLFIVSPDGGRTFLYTRNGEFQIIGNKLLTKTGMQVYGFKRIGGTSSSQIEPIDLSGLTYDPTNITWNQNGVLVNSYIVDRNTNSVVYGDEIPYQIALTSFPNPSGLLYRDGTTFSETLASGSPAAHTTPGSETVGIIAPRSKESANVSYTSEIVDSTSIQRALNSALTAIKFLNESISQFIQKLG